MPVKKRTNYKPLKLNQQMIRFCHEYILDYNGIEAARRAGYSGTNAALRTTAWRFLTSDIIKIKLAEIVDKIHQPKIARASQVLSEWSNLGFADPGRLLWAVNELDSAGRPTSPGTLKPISEMPPEVRRTIKGIEFDANGHPKLLLWDKHAALTNLGKHHKINNDSLEVKVDVSFSERLRRARERRLEVLKKECKKSPKKN